MPGPTLSPIERQRIAAAAKAAAEGQRVKWKAFGLKLWYEAGGKHHPVTSAPNRRVFEALAKQVQEEFRAQQDSAKRAAEKEAQCQARPVAFGAISPLDSEPSLCSLSAPGDASSAHGARRDVDEGIGCVVHPAVPATP